MSEFIQNKEHQPTPEQVLAAGAEFIEAFGIEPDPRTQPEEFLRALQQLNPRYEGNKNLLRYELELAQDSHDWPENIKSAIIKAAEGMRMVEFDAEGRVMNPETPLVGRYDLVIALGGARMENLERPRYAADSIKKGVASFDRLVVSGSARDLRDDEKPIAHTYAPGAVTEFDACDAAAKIVAEENPELEVSAYPGGEEKARTPDVLDANFRYLRARGLLPEEARVGIVTTQIYQAYTAMDAQRIGRKYNVQTMTAGKPSDPAIIERRTPATYKSEVVRALEAAALALQAEKQ